MCGRPFPQADHCIASDPVAEAYYTFYGGMMRAIHGAKYLLKTHAVSVRAVGGTSATLVANAFEMPSPSSLTASSPPVVGAGGGMDGAAASSPSYNGYGMLWPVMLGGGNATSSATLVVAYLPPSTLTSSFEVMLPSTDHSWKALPASDVMLDAEGGNATIIIPLFHGCALVRVKP